MPAKRENFLMPSHNAQVESSPATSSARPAASREREFRLTMVEPPALPLSLFRQIFERLREPKITVPNEYYRGEAKLPATDMPPWFRDLPNQLRVLLEKPREPIGIFNRAQEKKRAFLGLGIAAVGAAGGWLARGELGLGLGIVLGYALGFGAGTLLFKKRAYPPDIFQDYRMQVGSWINSVMVHAIALSVILLPFIISRLNTPVKASGRSEVVDISPYIPDFPSSGKRMGGGGGGGDRSPTPASKGALPKFSKTQFAPPMAKIPDITPQLPVQPTLLGPPELKLPQMASNMPWGDPQGVIGPASNGPGFGGGIGTGSGGGIGSGNGAGFGPGDTAGFGGGAYSVGGGISAPIPIYKPEPAYSEEARKAKFQGTVVLWIVVDVAGQVTDVRVVKPLGLGLDEKATEAVRTWKFKPALRNGTPVPVRVSVEVTFRLF